CIRAKTDLDPAGRLLAVNGERRLRSDREMTRLFHDLPDALTNTGELALRLGFTLKDLGYRFPDFPLPPGQTPLAHLRELVARGRGKSRSEEHTSELQSPDHLVCRLLLE